jgi:uncharacterized protein
MTAAELKTRTVRDLANLAKKKKVPGWHSMRKEELVKALLKQRLGDGSRSNGDRPNGNGSNGNGAKGNGAKGNGTKGNGSNGRNVATSAPSPKASRQLAEIHAKLAEAKDLTFRSMLEDDGLAKDRLVVMVRDPFWLHVYWELNRKSVERAKAALGQYWHGARPVLRLCEVLREGVTTSTRQSLRDIEIRGGANNWYVDVPPSPKSYQLDIGYLAPGSKFYCMARSNIVSMPSATDHDAFAKNWAEVAKDFDRMFALSGGYSEPETGGELKEALEERLQRPLGDPATAFGPGATGFFAHPSDFEFHVDTELIVHGATRPDAHVTLRGETVPLRNDGTFAVRFNLPDRRHVLPMVAYSGDGAEQRTIVLAVDRNTKVMEPVSHDSAE